MHAIQRLPTAKLSDILVTQTKTTEPTRTSFSQTVRSDVFGLEKLAMTLRILSYETARHTICIVQEKRRPTPSTEGHKWLRSTIQSIPSTEQLDTDRQTGDSTDVADLSLPEKVVLLRADEQVDTRVRDMHILRSQRQHFSATTSTIETHIRPRSISNACGCPRADAVPLEAPQAFNRNWDFGKRTMRSLLLESAPE